MAHFWAAALACSLHSSLQAFAFCEARNLFFLPSFTLPFSLVAHVSHVDRSLLALTYATGPCPRAIFDVAVTYSKAAY
jgi:hypothetical protein